MTEQRDKRKFLVVYDYGTGGAWAFVWAHSAAEIEQQSNGLFTLETG